MRQTVIIISLFSVLSAPVLAQEGSYRLDDARQLWRLTDNAAGLQIDSSRNRGFAEFQLQHSEGDYARVQEGLGLNNQLKFNTERYQSIGKYLVGYGHFTFDMERTKGRAWADVMRPYNSDPFFSGSSVSGKYDTQDFDLTAAVGTTAFSGFRFGVRLDYQVGDLSRLRDPRSRSQLLDYRITPAVTYTTGQHSIGLSGHYNRRKEKIPGMVTVQTDPNLKYYLMSGMEEARGTTGGYGGFNREWVNHEFGAALSYGFRASRLQSLTTIGISRGAEDVWGTYKYSPGRYFTYLYSVSTHNRLQTGKVLHQLDIAADYTQGYADEYRQQLVQEKDLVNGNTSYSYETQIEFRKRYQVKLFQADVRYRAHLLCEEKERAYAGLHLTAEDIRNKHLLPTSSLEYGGTTLMFEGGLSFLKDRLWLDLTVGGHVAKTPELCLADPTTDYAQGVLLPDMDYYRANYWRGRMEVKFLFPLTIKQVRSTWYVKVYTDLLRTNSLSSSYLIDKSHLDRKTVGISLGIFN